MYELRKIIKSVIKEEADFDRNEIEEKVDKANSMVENFSKDEIDELMDLFNNKLNGYGVEAIKVNGENDKYWGDTVGLYVDMGDTYALTVVYGVEENKFYLTSWGDFVEEYYPNYEE